MFAATQVQTAWAIDALYAYTGPLGVAFDTPNTPTVRLWAPTAQAVKLHVADATKTEVAAVDMTAGRERRLVRDRPAELVREATTGSRSPSTTRRPGTSST